MAKSKKRSASSAQHRSKSVKSSPRAKGLGIGGSQVQSMMKAAAQYMRASARVKELNLRYKKLIAQESAAVMRGASAAELRKIAQAMKSVDSQLRSAMAEETRLLVRNPQILVK